jgi:two-component system, NtrC family, sensor histidine kinase HydH
MESSPRINRFWTGVPPWVLLGAVVVLLPIFAFMTVQSIHRERELATRLLVEKGAALIRSFEAGTRTGMMGMQRGGFQLQRLLSETSQLPDIAYLVVTDPGGSVLAHSDPDRIGSEYGEGLDLVAVSRSKSLQYREVAGPGGATVLEVYRRFEPVGPPMGFMRGPMGRRSPEGLELPPDPPRVIFVGLDMTTVNESRRADILHAVVMGAVLLLVGFAGITLLLLAQNYRAARTSLARIKAFSDHVVDHMPIGLVATDGGGRIAAFNETAAALLQLPPTTAKGSPAAEILPVGLLSQLQASVTGAAVVEREIECDLPSGRQVALEVGARRLTGERGESLGSILLFRDLTELRALRDEMARNQRLATVGRLAAGVAHEIRNPLSSIKGFATYFRERYRDTPADVQTATIMIQEVDRLNRVVGQLLEFSRPIAILPRPVDIRRLVADSLRMVAAQAAEKGIAIETAFDEPAEAATLDADRLNQVLLNLYLNAVEAMGTGGTLGVRVAADRAAHAFEIRVSDTGCGIRPEDLPQIFEPYFTTRPGGTGLGLAIAHNIVSAMGGTIVVTSRPGAGATFTLRLPTDAGDRGRLA